jgi:Stage II sporulation protein E (SpoIIE)
MGSPLFLDGEWRVGITSNPNASQPDFDDSGWAIRNAQAVLAEVPEQEQPGGVRTQGNGPGLPTGRSAAGRRRYAWFRLHLRLPANHGPVALLVELPVSRSTPFGVGTTGPGMVVFANGRRITPEGPHGNAPEYYPQISRIYNLDLAPGDTSLVLAVRTLYIPFGFAAYTGFFANRRLFLGHPRDLERALIIWRNQTLFTRLPQLVYSILLTVLAIFLLALFFAQKGHVEYLWLALEELVQAPIGFVELAGSYARLDRLWYGALVVELILVSAYLFFEFLVAFLSLRRRWYIRLLRYTAPVLGAVGPTLLLVGRGRAVAVVLVLVLALSALWMLVWSVFIFTTLIAAALRRNFEAGLLLIPLVLGLVGIAEPVVTASMGEWTGHPYRSPLTVMAGPIPIHFASIADFTGILVIILIIFGRFVRIQRDQQRTSGELAAARSVQELMIPHEELVTPGFEVNSVYNPAQEVGGDFFHVQPADGGLLVVIGDVAGKGLSAAMNVSMLMGALRRGTERCPARILELLNRVLGGNGSFTTCQAIWYGTDGEVKLANAGHLPPYLNSQEVALPGVLPLGVLADARYEEISLYMHPGDRMLLLSDGVIEARQPSGELFGFERVHNLSNQSAFYIADAAKAFGQQDDITVLTVRRLAHTMAA